MVLPIIENECHCSYNIVIIASGFMVFLQTSDIFISGIFGLKKVKRIGDDETLLKHY